MTLASESTRRTSSRASPCPSGLVGGLLAVIALVFIGYGSVLIHEREESPEAYSYQQCAEWHGEPSLRECMGDRMDDEFWTPGEPWHLLGLVGLCAGAVCFLVGHKSTMDA